MLPGRTSLVDGRTPYGRFWCRLYTFGVIVRRELGEAAWGKYWSWDPKETWRSSLGDLRRPHARATAAGGTRPSTSTCSVSRR